jgi:hypothetical protein
LAPAQQYCQVGIKILPGSPHYWQYLVHNTGMVFRWLAVVRGPTILSRDKGPTILARAQNYWHRPDCSVKGFTNLAVAPQYWQYPHNTEKDPHTRSKTYWQQPSNTGKWPSKYCQGPHTIGNTLSTILVGG